MRRSPWLKGQQQSFAFHALKRKVYVARQPVSRVAVQMNPFHFGNFRNQPVPHGAELGCAAGNVGTGSLNGNAQPDDGCDIFGARPVAPFLGTAVNQVGQADALAAVQRANALLGMDFVAGQGERSMFCSTTLIGTLPTACTAVGVEQHAVFFAHGTDFGDRLNGADFIIGVHNADQRGILPNGVFHLLGCDQPFIIYRQISDFKPFFFQCGTGVQNRVMFKYGGDNMFFAFRRHQIGSAFDRPVV